MANPTALSDAEREITKIVVRRFMDRDEVTTELDVMRELKPLRAVISESLRKLVDRGVLYVVNNTYTQETYVPRTLAFHYCGDAEALTFAKKSTELMLQIVRNIVEREVDSGSKDDTKQYTKEDSLAEAKAVDPNVTAQVVRVGLALAEEFSVFQGLQRNVQQFGVAVFRPSRHIFQIGPNPWDEHIRRCSPSVERTWEQNQRELREITLPPLSAAGFEADMQVDNRKIFLVHGHADEVKQTVAEFMRSLGLEVIILHEEANEGQTIVEKFEKHANVGFAIVLLTPDDFGRSAKHPDKTQLRARQNVILELGIFIGKLGRKRVCPLYVDGVELPSDIHGVLYVPYDQGGDWRRALAKEIIAAGIEVDTKKLAAQSSTDAAFRSYILELINRQERMGLLRG
jgi:hypothetical protein